MIAIRYRRKVGEEVQSVELERAEIEEPEKMAEFLNGIRARLFPGVELKAFVPAKPEEAPKPPVRRRLDEEKPLEIVDEDEVAAATAGEQAGLF